MKPSLGFTLKADPGGLLRVLITDCHACAAFDPASPPTPVPSFEPFKAIWDTGATNSVITQDVVDKCGLKPIGMTQVHDVQGVRAAETFLVNVMLPNNVAFASVTVTLGKLPPGAHMLIGMDIITSGDFSITNVGNNTIFSFRFPSQRVVDYVKEIQDQVAQASLPKYQHQASGHKKKKRPPKQFGKRKK